MKNKKHAFHHFDKAHLWKTSVIGRWRVESDDEQNQKPDEKDGGEEYDCHVKPTDRPNQWNPHLHHEVDSRLQLHHPEKVRRQCKSKGEEDDQNGSSALLHWIILGRTTQLQGCESGMPQFVMLTAIRPLEMQKCKTHGQHMMQHMSLRQSQLESIVGKRMTCFEADWHAACPVEAETDEESDDC